MMTERPAELELKYRVLDPEVAVRVLADDTLGSYEATGPARTIQNEDHYVDTPDGALARAGFAARFRRSGGSTLISVKSLHRPAGALHRRDELEGPADRALVPMDWPPSAARSLVLELCGDAPLVELVTVRQLRRKRRFATEGSEVELSVDDADVVDRGRIADRFTELEVELVAGDPAPLEALQGLFDAEPGLRASSESKLEAALGAAGIPLPGAGRAAAPVPVTAGAAGADAGEAASDAPAPVTGPADDGLPSAAERALAVEGEAPALTEPAAPIAEAGIIAPGPEPVAASPTVPTASAEGDRPATEPSEARRAKRGRRPGAATTGARDRAAELPPLVVGKTPGVRADDTLAEAGRRILRFHLARMLAREEGTRSGKDAEDLHAMRVATRRMRAAWRVFGGAYRPARTRQYLRDLRYVAGRLGAVRDLDVLIDGLEGYRKGLGDDEQAALVPLLETWTSRRDDARGQLITTLDSGAYRRFVDEYREFVVVDGLGVQPVAATEPHRVRDTMPSRIWLAYEQVRAYEPVLRWADVETLHELRIAAKWLRYTVEFVREPLGPDAGPLIERVVALQDHLGWLHDADVAAGLARTFLVEHAVDLDDRQTAATARYLMDRERERQRLRRSIGLPWRRVAGVAYRRTLARVVADL